MLGRKTSNLASPRSRETTRRTASERTANPDQGQEASDRGDTYSDHTMSVIKSGVKLAAAYARVSTDRQEKQETIASQLDA
jgi:hypothetical protein